MLECNVYDIRTLKDYDLSVLTDFFADEKNRKTYNIFPGIKFGS